MFMQDPEPMQEEKPQAGFVHWLIDTLFRAPRALAVEDHRLGLRFMVRRQLFRNLGHHSRKLPISQIEEWVQNPVCTADNCGAEVVRLLPAAGTFGISESCPGCHRKLPLKLGASPGEHTRHEIQVPLPKLKRALFSALRELRREKIPFQGTIDVDLISTLENLAL